MLGEGRKGSKSFCNTPGKFFAALAAAMQFQLQYGGRLEMHYAVFSPFFGKA
jgi:hypothetical protein